MAKSQMPGYLLRAPASDMERWKAAAKSSGQPLANFARSALDHATSPPDYASFEHLPGRFVSGDMVVVSRECWRNDHTGCTPGCGCECSCHPPVVGV